MSKPPVSAYTTRVVDNELDELFDALPALALEGPKAVGKTATAERRVNTTFRLDDPDLRTIVSADPNIITSATPPILIDEWQHLPVVWDKVRRAVDQDPTPNRYILAGSAAPTVAPTHSGAGRIVTVRMRPLALSERGLATPTVSLQALLSGTRPSITGQTTVGLSTYASEIIASGFPGIRRQKGRARRALLEAYIERIVDRDFIELGHPVRKPDTLRRWMTAYAAATGTTATFEKIRNASTSGEGEAPTKVTVGTYRDVLERLWIIDPVPGWLPSRNQLARLTQSPKHHLADPALSASLLGIDEDALLIGATTSSLTPRDGTLFGQLFESLVTLSVRVYAQSAEARVRHLRTKDGRQEIDLIVERPNQKILALEIKLSATVTDDDVKHLLWLRQHLGAELLDSAVITTGTHAYRRPDGIAVIPAALFGP